MRNLITTIRDNSLSITLFTLFALCISAQSFLGRRVQNEALAQQSHRAIGYCQYLSTGTFWEGISSNWQAAVLQLGSLIMFSSFLYQRGAPHSLDPRNPKRKQERRRNTRYYTWIYRHSLSLAFLSLFVLSFILHLISGAGAYNEVRTLAGQAPVSTMAYLLSASFWSTTLQTWQAEYLVIALCVVLTVFLRQQNSPESKQVKSRNETTGQANK